MLINNIPRPEHPEPMFQRVNWQNLNGEWLFSVDYCVSGEERGMQKADSDAEYNRKITVPFCPESDLSGIGIKDFMPSVWYKKKIIITENQLNGLVLLHFGAVDYSSTIWVNGEKAGRHIGGYSSFVLDITKYLKVGENDITVNAKDDLRNSQQPRGKQSDSLKSYGCLYTRVTGIWQTVWLEFVPKGYIKSVKYYPDINSSAFDIEMLLSMPGRVTVEAFFDGKSVGIAEKQSHGNNLRINLPLSAKHLWEVGNGRLYDLKLKLETDYGVDIVSSYAGLREIRLDGLKFLLNGKSVFQRTVLDQGYYPDGIYTAPTDEALKHDVEISMSLGFNGARLHQKVFEPRFLYHCDKAGYLVWGEQGSWGIDTTNENALLHFLPEWSEIIERDFNHPSIIGWIPFNEVWQWHFKGIENLHRVINEVYKATKKLDATRPVIDASGGFHSDTDIYDQHDYEQNPEKFKNDYAGYDGKKESYSFYFEKYQTFVSDLPFFMSEYGGIKWIPENLRDDTLNNSWGYGNAPETEEEFLSRYEGLTTALLEAPNIMGFCYTQLYDVEQEVNGLYTYSRENKFASYDRIIKANTGKAAIED